MAGITSTAFARLYDIMAVKEHRLLCEATARGWERASEMGKRKTEKV